MNDFQANFDDDSSFVRELQTMKTTAELTADWSLNKLDRFKIVLEKHIRLNSNPSRIIFENQVDQLGKRKLLVETYSDESKKSCKCLIDLEYVLSDNCNKMYPIWAGKSIADKIRKQPRGRPKNTIV